MYAVYYLKNLPYIFSEETTHVFKNLIKGLLNLKKSKPFWKRPRNIILIVIAVFFFGISGLAAKVYHDVKNTAEEIYTPMPKEVNNVREESEEATAIDTSSGKPISILLMGVDRRENEQGRADTLMVLTVNPKEKSTQVVSIPRDTRTEIVGHGTVDKINHSYAFGGAAMTINTVQNFLNIPIDYYVETDMDGFVEIIDAIGGIDVNNAFAFSSGGHSFEEGNIHMGGEEALAYVRMRKSDPEGDFGRQKRQQQVVEAIIQKGLSVKSITNYSDILDVISANVETNISFDTMKDIAKNYRDAAQSFVSLTLPGAGQKIDGIYYYVVADQDRLNLSMQLRTHLGLEN